MSSPAQQELSWLPEMLTRLALASGVGHVAAAYSVSRWLTRPTRGGPLRTPSGYGLIWEPLECRTADALRLTGWVVSPARPRGTVGLFHGLRQDRGQTLDRTAFLVAAGYRCVAFDHRAHGTSGGKQTSFGFHEARDVAAVLDLIQRRWPHDPQAALGISMGAAALCFAANRVRHLQAVILESMYHDIAGAFVRRIGNKFPPWFKQLSDGVIWVTERRLRLRLDQLAPAEFIGGLAPAPVLLLTGTADQHAPPEDIERLLQRCRGPREICLVSNAGHMDICETGGEFYRNSILDFLERRLAWGQPENAWAGETAAFRASGLD